MVFSRYHAISPPTTHWRETYGTQGTTVGRARGRRSRKVSPPSHCAPPCGAAGPDHLRAGQGLQVPAMARQVVLSTLRVRTWVHRFTSHGLSGLANALRAPPPLWRDASPCGDGGGGWMLIASHCCLVRARLLFSWTIYGVMIPLKASYLIDCRGCYDTQAS